MPKRKCPVCGSSKWHKEPASGVIACSEGHVLQNYRNETNEKDELGAHTMRKRAVKSGKKKKERISKADPKLYHGDRARFLYFQCCQLMLRQQIAALTKLWELPTEFEVVCRDIWAMHLSLLPSPPSPEPLIHADERGDSRSGKAKGGQLPTPSDTQHDLRERSPESESLNNSGEDGTSSSYSSSSDAGDNSDRPAIDSGLDELMRELSEAEFSDDEEAEANKQRRPQGMASRKKRKGHSPYESPVANMSVLVLACWTMRLPIIYMDLISLIESYDLPYLEPLRRGLLPPQMSVHLNKQTKQALSPPFAPTTMAIHTLSSRLSRLMLSKYDVHTPELNAAPILWRCVRALEGTPQLYMLTKSLGKVLSLPLTLHNTLAPSLEKLRASDPERHQYDSVPPEVALLATTAIVLKMVYGLDGVPRVPGRDDDPACALPRLAEYLNALKAVGERHKKSEGQLFNSQSEMSVMDLTDDLLDRYLEFGEKALLSDPANEERSVLRDYFPRLSADSEGATARQPRVNCDSSPSVTLPANVPARPPGLPNAARTGEKYRIYQAHDVLGGIPEELDLVLTRASVWCGVEIEVMEKVVMNFERRLLRWWKEEVRRKRGEKEEGV